MAKELEEMVKVGKAPVVEEPKPWEPEAGPERDGCYIRGRVDCGVGLEGAEIRVFDDAGTMLNLPPPQQSALARSSAAGTFIVGVTHVPDHIRIVADDARCGDWVTHLKLDVRGFDPARDIALVNPVSTLLAAYLDGAPGMAPAKAQADVKRFLGIPESVDLNRAGDLAEAPFDAMGFLGEAENVGGIEPLLDALLKQMNADPSSTHFFGTLGSALPGEGFEAGPEELYRVGAGGLYGSAGTWIANKLASGAVNYVAGQATGWLMHRLGLKILPDPMEVLEEVKQDLNEIKDGIHRMSLQLKDTTDELKEEIRQTDYDVRVGQLGLLLSNVHWASTQLALLAENAAALDGHIEDDPGIATQKADLMRVMRDLLPQFEVIHNQQVGIGGAEGLIKVWSRIVAGRHRFVGPEASAKMRHQFDYFDALQLSLFNLALEYLHATGAPERSLTKLVSTYQMNREQQLEMLPERIPAGTVVERRSKMMIATDTLTRDTEPRDMRWLYRDRAGQLNASRWKGFDDWHMPRKDEVTQVFEGWHGSSVAEWAISEAYPQENLWPELDVFAAIPWTWRFSFKDGSLKQCACKQKYMRHAKWRSGECLSPSSLLVDGGQKGYLLPLRNVRPEELYYY